MNTFRPSIDWSDEFLNSTLWVLQVWVITASCLLVVLVVVERTTEWGRQFWRITGDYFKGRQSAPVWAVVGLLLLSAILVVRINVLLSYYANDLFSALQITFQPGSARNTGIHGFWSTILVFAVLAVCYVARTLADLYLTQRFIMRWRIWLSRRFIDDWLGDYRVLPQPVLATADRQPGPTHPARHRHLHRGCRRPAEQSGIYL